ncbi:hypothetical protein Tco_0049321 [Tanacetum coccineum]
MYRMTMSFLQGEVAVFSHGWKKASSSWKQSEGGDKPNFNKGFKNKQRPDRKPDRFSLLTKTPKGIFALEKGKFKAPPLMVTPAKKRDPNKYCEFHSDTGHSTDECMQLRKQIEEMIKSGKLSQFIRELKQNDKPKAPKKGEASGKDKPLAILMIQPWERVAKPRITQSFCRIPITLSLHITITNRTRKEKKSELFCRERKNRERGREMRENRKRNYLKMNN